MQPSRVINRGSRSPMSQSDAERAEAAQQKCNGTIRVGSVGSPSSARDGGPIYSCVRNRASQRKYI